MHPARLVRAGRQGASLKRAVIPPKRSTGVEMHTPNVGPLLALTPQEFEKRIAELLRRQGYRDVQVVGGSGDLAADIICRTAHRQGLLVVQCKRYDPSHKVGSREIQTFIGMVTVHHRADQGMFVTTSSFTEQARKLAEQHRIRLIDGPELARLAASHGLLQTSTSGGQRAFKEALNAAQAVQEAAGNVRASWTAMHNAILQKLEEQSSRKR